MSYAWMQTAELELKALQAAAETLSNHAMRADALDALLLVPVFVARRTSS